MSEEQEAYNTWLALQDIGKMASGYESAVDQLQRQGQEIDILRQQNAQLLEALKYIMNWTPDKWNPETARDLARAAIAAVEGNSHVQI